MAEIRRGSTGLPIFDPGTKVKYIGHNKWLEGYPMYGTVGTVQPTATRPDEISLVLWPDGTFSMVYNLYLKSLTEAEMHDYELQDPVITHAERTGYAPWNEPDDEFSQPGTIYDTQEGCMYEDQFIEYVARIAAEDPRYFADLLDIDYHTIC